MIVETPIRPVRAEPAPWPHVRAALEAAGLHPRDVRTLGVNARGYWNRAGEWAEWPEPAVGVAVLEAIVRDREDMAAAGISA